MKSPLIRTLGGVAALVVIWLGIDCWVIPTGRFALSVPPRPSAVNPVGNPFVLPCKTGGDESTLTVPGKVILDERFVESAFPSPLLSPSPSSNGVIRKAIEEQLKFTFGNFFENPATLAAGRFFPDYSPLEIRILQVRRGNYGRSLDVDKVEGYAPEGYVARAVAIGHADAADPAIIAEYEARIRITACRATEGTRTPSLLLPYDPYLAYWLVPGKERRLLSWGGEKSMTTPCGSQEMAHLRKPSQYWLVWNPQAKGLDAKGVRFDCQEILTPGVDYGAFSATAEISSKGKAFVFGEPLRQKQGPLSISLIFGPLEPWRKRFDPVQVTKDLTAQPGSLVQSAQLCLARDMRAERDSDAGYLGFLYFLSNLPEVFDISGSSVTREPNAAVMLIHAKLKLSHRTTTLHIYYGDTNVKAVPGRHHWAFLLEALGRDDIILHLGHSGMGNNLNLARMIQDLDLGPGRLRKIASRKPYQIFGSLGCNSYSYYMADFERLRSNPGSALQTDLMMMASSNYRPLFHLGLMRYIDRLMAGDNPNLYDSLQPFIRGNDSYVFKRVASE